MSERLEPVAQSSSCGEGTRDDISLGSILHHFEDRLFAKACRGKLLLGDFEKVMGIRANDVNPHLFAGHFNYSAIRECLCGVGDGGNELVCGFEGHRSKNLGNRAFMIA